MNWGRKQCRWKGSCLLRACLFTTRCLSNFHLLSLMVWQNRNCAHFIGVETDLEFKWLAPGWWTVASWCRARSRCGLSSRTRPVTLDMGTRGRIGTFLEVTVVLPTWMKGVYRLQGIRLKADVSRIPPFRGCHALLLLFDGVSPLAPSSPTGIWLSAFTPEGLPSPSLLSDLQASWSSTDFRQGVGSSYLRAENVLTGALSRPGKSGKRLPSRPLERTSADNRGWSWKSNKISRVGEAEIEGEHPFMSHRKAPHWDLILIDSLPSRL